MSRLLSRLLMLLPLVSATDVVADHCPEVVTAAEEIAAMRDRDPAAGVTRGREMLADLQARHACDEDTPRLMGAIGANLNVLGQNAEAAEIFEAALQLAGTGAPNELLASLHRGAGLAWYDLDDYERALEHYFASLEAAERSGDALAVGRTAANIGVAFITLAQLDRAEEYQLRALAAFEGAEWAPGIGGTLINLGSLAARRALEVAESDPEAARRFNVELGEYNRRALALFEEMGNPRGIAYAAANIGLSHDRLGEPELALTFYEQSLQVRRELGDRNGIIDSLVTMASALTKVRRFDEAEAALVEAETLLPADHLSMRVTLLQPWVALEEARGNIGGALERQRELTQIQVQLATADNVTRVAEIESRYANERQERQIAELEHEQALNRDRLKRQRVTLISSIAIALLLLALVAALFARYRLQVRAQLALEQVARTDDLTGLANRRHMRERIEYEIQRSRRSTRPFSVALVDIDNFKQINDKLGHAAGDKALVAITERLRNLLRKQDTLARWGGDELLMLLPETDESGAMALARKVVVQFQSHPIVVDKQSLLATVTIGVAQYWPGMDIDQCLQGADDAMYLGKRAGRSQVQAKHP